MPSSDSADLRDYPNKQFFLKSFRRFGRYLFGYFYSFIGLTLFLYGVYSGFLAVGTAIGQNVSGDSMFLVLTISFLLGVFMVLAELAVYPLTNRSTKSPRVRYPKIGLAFAVAWRRARSGIKCSQNPNRRVPSLAYSASWLSNRHRSMFVSKCLSVWPLMPAGSQADRCPPPSS